MVTEVGKHNELLHELHSAGRIGFCPHVLEDLFSNLELTASRGNLCGKVSHLSIDSRKVVPGSLFFAIGGHLTDGNFFVEEAMHRGACAIVSESPPPQHCLLPHIQVGNIREMLAVVARRYYGCPDQRLRVTGITGTNGKTTVTMLAQHLLHDGGRSSETAVFGTVHHDLGKRIIPSTRTTPEAHDICSMMATAVGAGCKRALIEVSSHGVCQKRVYGLNFETAVFLNLTPEHLDYHTDMEDYYSAKRAFVAGECVAGPKRVVINLDDEYGKRLFHEIPDGVCKIGFGEDSEAHFRVRKVRYGSTETEFELECPAGVIDVRSPMIGRFNVQNVLAALAIGWIEGREIGGMVDRLEEFEGSPGRLESVREGQGFNVLIDYAHTSDALKNILSVLREVTDGRLLLVFGCGGDRDQKKRPDMTRAAQEFCDFAWATADNPRSEPLDSIFEHMRAGVREPGRIQFVKNRRRAIGLAIEQARPRDCLVIAGKGHESYQEFNNTVVPFDDRSVARELLRLLKASTGEVAQW